MKERIDLRRDQCRCFAGSAVADTVEFDEATVWKRFVNSTGAFAEEVRSIGASQDEHGSIDIEMVRKSISLDGTVHPDNRFGEIHAFRPNRPLCQPGVEINCDALPLVAVAAAVPEATLTLDLQFNHGDQPLFIATVTGGSRTAIENAFGDAFDVGEWVLVGQAGDTRRYQVHPALSLEEQLGDHIDDLSELETLATANAIIERIEVHTDGWQQTGWFANREAFSLFSSFWQRNASIRLHRLIRDGEPASPGNGLTDHQHEALRTAYELGYFDIPRHASLKDIAAELDISASSVSERLRRAQTRLIQETVATTWPSLPN